MFDELKKLLSHHNHQIHLNIGAAFYRQNMYMEAAKEFGRLEKTPNASKTDLFIYEYRNFLASGNIDGALEMLAFAQNADSTDKLVQFYLASHEEMNGNIEGAQEIYNDILGINDSDITAEAETTTPNDRLAAALVYDALEQYENALTAYDDILGNESSIESYQLPEIYLLKAQTLAKMEKYNESYDAACEAYGIGNQRYVAAMIHMAKMQDILGGEEAMRILDDAAKVNPQDTGALQIKSEVAYQNKKYDLSIDACDKIIAIRKAAGADKYYLGEASYRKGWGFVKKYDYSNALESYDVAINSDPENILYHLSKGAVCVALQRHQEACCVFVEAYKLYHKQENHKYGHLPKKLVEYAEYDIKDLSGKLNYDHVGKERADFILSFIEDLDDRNGVDKNFVNLEQAINNMMYQFQTKQAYILQEIMYQHDQKVSALSDEQRNYYNTFVDTLNHIYVEYQKLYHRHNVLDIIEDTVIHKVSSVFSFISHISGINEEIATSHKHAENFIQLAQNEEVFDAFAKKLALKATLDHESLGQPRKVSSVLSHIASSFDMLCDLDIGQKYNSPEARIAHHDACSVASEICHGRISVYPSKDVIDRACDFVVHHEVYYVPIHFDDHSAIEVSEAAVVVNAEEYKVEHLGRNEDVV